MQASFLGGGQPVDTNWPVIELRSVTSCLMITSLYVRKTFEVLVKGRDMIPRLSGQCRQVAIDKITLSGCKAVQSVDHFVSIDAAHSGT